MTNKELQVLLAELPDDLIVYTKTTGFSERVAAVRRVPQKSKIGKSYDDIIMLDY